jgi:hypothetical protein
MVNRLLRNWTIIRVVYLLLGSFVAIQAGMHSEWLGMTFGIYFASMGLFGFGCARGSCGYVPTKQTKPEQDLVFEEVKEQKP